ncbi:hypothetical protein EYF80_014963 [Liparis tanakae]|uniref:Uncharacterized protein n=1 Tax=Liparis tanakae TaxID=230148 RepID=A0A4Z2ICQ1_9TELE|nr:hypothetical protein EYF80_014963 [Liparis tanakae]
MCKGGFQFLTLASESFAPGKMRSPPPSACLSIVIQPISFEQHTKAEEAILDFVNRSAELLPEKSGVRPGLLTSGLGAEEGTGAGDGVR